MRAYKCLSKQVFELDNYQLVPIRDEDKYLIMQWRNEQIHHLRQSKPLTKQNQEAYFRKVVAQLFDQEQPNQILFSYLEGDVCIGYGGLVHINWLDKYTEISFIINTALEKVFFKHHWTQYLTMLEKVAFEHLNFHKIFTYAFDLRPHLYQAVLCNGFVEEARLKEHCLFDGQFIDVVIHSKINHNIQLRKANINDLDIYFHWANDTEVRENAIQTLPILYENHSKWFEKRIKSPKSLLYYFELNKQPLGQVRFDYEEGGAFIDYSLDRKFRGKGFGYLILKKSIEALHTEEGIWKSTPLLAKVKQENKASELIFRKLNFRQIANITIDEVTYHCFEK